MKRIALWAALAVALLLARPAHAQMSSGALAETSCLGGRIQSVIDMALVGTDSLQEVVVHEMKHQEQARKFAPGCPNYTNPAELLVDEVEAYCASRPYRIARGWSKDSVDNNYLLRLRSQFDRALHPLQVVIAYKRGCP